MLATRPQNSRGALDHLRAGHALDHSPHISHHSVRRRPASERVKLVCAPALLADSAPQPLRNAGAENPRALEMRFSIA